MMLLFWLTCVVIVIYISERTWSRLTFSNRILIGSIGKKATHTSISIPVGKEKGKIVNFFLDQNDIIRGGFAPSRTNLTKLKRNAAQSSSYKDDDIYITNIAREMGLQIDSIDYATIWILDKKRRYVFYVIEDVHGREYNYVEDPTWNNSISQTLNLPKLI